MAAKTTEIRGLSEALAAVDGEVARKASVRSVNDVTTLSRTEASRQIRETYNVKAKSLNDRMKVTKLSQSGGGSAKITTTGRRFGLDSFTGTRVLKSGVSAQIRKDRPRTLFQWAFQARTRSGVQLIMERVWRAKNVGAQRGRVPKTRAGALPKYPYRYPIQRVETIGAAPMFDQDRVYGAVQKLVDDRYDDIYQRNYAYYAGQVP